MCVCWSLMEAPKFTISFTASVLTKVTTHNTMFDSLTVLLCSRCGSGRRERRGRGRQEKRVFMC